LVMIIIIHEDTFVYMPNNPCNATLDCE